MDQLLAQDQEYMRLASLVASDLIAYTGCSVPCRFIEYKIAGTPMNMFPEKFGLTLGFAKAEIMEEEEVYVYGFVSFVSEFGGSLGLFLGFSFLMVWELLEPFFFIAFKMMRGHLFL